MPFLKRTKKELENELSHLVGEELYNDFKRFAFQGDFAKMIVAFILGGASQRIIAALTNNLIMPLINFLLSYTGSDWRTIVYAPIDGLSFEIGLFLGSVIEFILMAIILYTCWKLVFEEKPAITCYELIVCPYCRENIHWQATRCPKCTSKVRRLDES